MNIHITVAWELCHFWEGGSFPSIWNNIIRPDRLVFKMTHGVPNREGDAMSGPPNLNPMR